MDEVRVLLEEAAKKNQKFSKHKNYWKKLYQNKIKINGMGSQLKLNMFM